MDAFQDNLTEAVVAYHYPCPDGVFAALAAHLKLQQWGFTARFVPNRVFSPESVESLNLKGTEIVFLLDFAGPKGFAESVARVANRVVLLDHHKTAAEYLSDTSKLPSNLAVNIDMNKSGATLALNHFKPEGLTAAQEMMFKYVEDADLWRWSLVNSKEFHAGLGSLGLEYDANKNPAIFDQLLSLSLDELFSKGRKALKRDRQLITAALKDSFTVTLGGEYGRQQGWGQCLAVQTDLSNLRSQLGNELAQKSAEQGLRAVGLVAYTEADMRDASKLKCSLRSIGDEDTTVVSQAWEGGGHRNASSFLIPKKEFKTWALTLKSKQ